MLAQDFHHFKFFKRLPMKRILQVEIENGVERKTFAKHGLQEPLGNGFKLLLVDLPGLQFAEAHSKRTNDRKLD